MSEYEWIDENYLKDAKLTDFKDYTFNIVFDLDDYNIEKLKKQVLEVDNRYYVEINKDILNPKKHGFFKTKEESIYDIIQDNLGFSNNEMYNLGLLQLRSLNLENLLYRQPKSIATKQKLALSMVIDSYKNKNHYLITDEMFINNDYFCKMVSWLLERVENNNGSIVWLTNKSIDEIDDVCEGGIKYPSNTCFYYQSKSVFSGYAQLKKTDQRRKQQSFYVEYKEKDFVFNKNAYDFYLSIIVENCTPQKLTYLKYYLKKYDLDLIDLILKKGNGELWLKIGIVGKDRIIAIYDILLFLKLTNMCTNESFNYFDKDFSFTDIVYYKTESSKIIFLSPDTEETITFNEANVPFNSEELSEIIEFTMLELRGRYVGLYKEINNRSKEYIILSEYKDYIKQKGI